MLLPLAEEEEEDVEVGAKDEEGTVGETVPTREEVEATETATPTATSRMEEILHQEDLQGGAMGEEDDGVTFRREVRLDAGMAEEGDHLLMSPQPIILPRSCMSPTSLLVLLRILRKGILSKKK